MDRFKDFYNNRNGKIILFFSFYLVFFIFLGIYMRSLKNNKPKDTIKDEAMIEEKLTTYNINHLINNDYSYSISIIDDNDIIAFNGTKNNIDYGNYFNKYFLDIYNINQLLKRSKFIDSKNLVLSYELKNSELNDILLTNKKDATNKIDVLVNKSGEVKGITMNLSKYMEKEKYEITINYKQGEENENSVS